ncbi:hypothetical protein ACFYUR_18785 [Micromonospora haikouensis]|uniref:hypothetical protein n=1 Tax=Micromonospora haikouensis TaxID=686309 RepID=UPI0036749E39
MADRTVSVRLRMQVHDYTSGAAQAALATNRLADQLARLEREASGVGKGLDAAARRVTASAKKFDAAARIYEGSANRFASSSAVWEQQAAQAGEAADKLGAASKTVQQSAGRHDRASKRYEAAAERWAASSDKFAAAARTHEAAAGRLGTVSVGGGVEKVARDADEAGNALSELGRRTGMVLAVTASAAAAAGGAIQYIAPAAVAAGAAAGTLPGILGGAAAAMGTVKVASIGLSDALGDLFEVDDPFKQLSPSAKALVQEVGRLKPQLLGLQQSLQDAAYASAAGNLERLATDTLPTVGRQAAILAHDWSLAMTAITDAATDPMILGGFQQVTATADRIFDQLIVRIQPVARALSSVAVAADPLVRVIGDRLAGAIDSMTAGIARARSTGDLAEFFASGAESASALLSITGDLASIIGNVISAVNNQNSAIVGTARALDAYMASGRGAEDIAGIVDTLTAAYEGMAQVLGPLGSIARDALADPGTRDGLATMFDILATGSAALRVVFDLFQGLPDPIQSVVVAAIALGVVAQKTTTGIAAMGVAAQGAAAKMAAMGPAGQKAATGMTGLASATGKAVTALVALQLAGVVFDQFVDPIADVDRLTKSVENLAETGKTTGELARVFGDNLEGLGLSAATAGDKWFPNLGRSIESLIPPTKSLNELFYGESFTGSRERIQSLDAAIAQYAKTTNNTAGVNAAWNRVLSASGLDAGELAKIMPQTVDQMERLNGAAHGGAGSLAALETRARTLTGGLQGAVTSGRDLIDVFNELNGAAISSAEAEIKAEESVDRLSAALKENGRALNKQGTDFDIANEKGRENKQLTLDMIQAAAEAAQKRFEETGSVEQAAGVYDKYIEALRKTLHGAKLTDEQIDALIERYGMMPPAVTTPVTAPGATTAASQVGGVLYQIRQLPNGKVVVIGAKTAQAMADMRAAKAVLQSFRDRSFTITGQVRWTSSGNLKVPGGTQLRRWGGIDRPVAMASGGMMQAGIYPASNPPLVKFAEPETGGEAYIPRKGDRNRNLSILSEAASWSNARVVPMASGGIIAGGSMIAAASGLVAYGASASATSTDRGSALESVEAYIQARDAIQRLNESLKENGRSFSLSTKKGRENYSAVISSVKAAEEAAQAKFRETGSVKAANKEYDAHIAKLKSTLKQQKVSAATIDSLMKKLAQRPTYDTPGPVGSEKNIAAAQAAISAEGSLASITDLFSLNKPIFDVKDETGRENLTALFRFLKDAQDAAQAVLEQTGDKKKATGVYDSYVEQLRKILSGSGMAKSQIDSLLKQYGKIVLTPNAIGGVYMGSPSGLLSLSEGGLFDSAKTLYGFAERGTGGELFLPRLGSRRRGEDLLSIGAGWYGGRYVRGGQGQGVSTQVTNNLTVNSQSGPPSLSEMSSLLRQMDARARVGRKG